MKEEEIMNYIKNKPIYLQIAHDIVIKIISGEIKKASLLPSVRELSVTYSVTPKTIQNVTQYLSDNHILDKKPGVGSVVTANETIVKKLHQFHGMDETKEYIESMKNLYFTEKEIMTFLKNEFMEEDDD